MLILALVGAFGVMYAGRQIGRDARSGWFRTRDRVRLRVGEIRAGRAPAWQRATLAAATASWTVSKAAGRGARYTGHSIADGARKGAAEGRERAREYRELSEIDRSIKAEQERSEGAGETEPSQAYHDLHDQYYTTRGRIDAHREARGSRRHRGAGPEPWLLDGELHFGAEAEDPNGAAECAFCAGNGVMPDGEICPDCHRRQRIRNQWFERDNRPAVEWDQDRRRASKQAQHDMKHASDGHEYKAAERRWDATKSAGWNPDSPVPEVSDEELTELLASPSWEERARIDTARDAERAVEQTSPRLRPVPDLLDPDEAEQDRPRIASLDPDFNEQLHSTEMSHPDISLVGAGESGGSVMTTATNGHVGGGAQGASGEAVNISMARDALDALRTLAEQASGQVEALSASLSSLKMDDATLAEISAIAEAADVMASSATKARSGMDERHSLMEQAVKESQGRADLSFYEE